MLLNLTASPVRIAISVPCYISGEILPENLCVVFATIFNRKQTQQTPKSDCFFLFADGLCGGVRINADIYLNRQMVRNLLPSKIQVDDWKGEDCNRDYLASGLSVW